MIKIQILSAFPHNIYPIISETGDALLKCPLSGSTNSTDPTEECSPLKSFFPWKSFLRDIVTAI